MSCLRDSYASVSNYFDELFASRHPKFVARDYCDFLLPLQPVLYSSLSLSRQASRPPYFPNRRYKSLFPLADGRNSFLPELDLRYLYHV